jgi:hypothetical protein
MADILDRLYSTLVESDEEHGQGDLPEEAMRDVPGNAAKLVSGFTLQKIGDRIADPKTALAWMLTSRGLPRRSSCQSGSPGRCCRRRYWSRS